MSTESTRYIGVYIFIVLGILYLYALVYITYADISSQNYISSITVYEEKVRETIKSTDFFDEFRMVKQFLSFQVQNTQDNPELYIYQKMIFDHRGEYVMVRLYYTYPNSLGIRTEYKQEFLFSQEGKLITELQEKE